LDAPALGSESATMIADEIRARSAESLRELRTQAGVSRERLAEMCGLHRTEIGLLERAARSRAWR
jgi:DNA-binding XRE family transcriptional regulator